MSGQKRRVARLCLGFLGLVAWASSVQAQASVQIYDNGRVRFIAPDEWLVFDYGQSLILADSRESISAGAFLEGERFRVELIAGDVGIAPYYFEAGASAEEILLLSQAFPSEEMCQAYSEARRLEADSAPPLLISTRVCSSAEQVLIVADLANDDIGVLNALVPLGQSATYEAALTSVAQSLSLVPPPPLESLPSVSLVPDSTAIRLTSRDQTLQVAYPSTWLAEEDASADGYFGITSGPVPFFPQPDPTQTSLLLTFITPERLPRAYRQTPAQALLFLDREGLGGVPFLGVQEFVLDGRRAARRALENQQTDAWLLALELADGQGFAVGQFLAPAGEWNFQAETIYNILSSVRYDAQAFSPPESVRYSLDPAQLIQAHTNRATGFSLFIPEAWDVSTTLVEQTALSVITPYIQERAFSLSAPERARPFALISRSALSKVGAEFSAQDANRAAAVLRFIGEVSTSAGDIEAFELAGRQAARATRELGSVRQATFVLMFDEDNYLYVAVFALPEELESFSDAILEIAKTAQMVNE